MKKHTRQMLKSLLTMMLVVIMVLSSAVPAMAAPGRSYGRSNWGRGWWNWWGYGYEEPESAAEEAEEEEAAPEESVTEEAEEPESAAEESEEAAEEEAVSEEAAVEEAAEEAASEESEAEEIPAEEETPAAEEPAEVIFPAQNFKAEDADNDLTVTVEAPEGALPENAGMRIRKVKASDYQAAAMDAVSGEIDVVLAVDISFYDENGAEIEPAVPVQVTMTAPEIAQIAEPIVVHISDEAEATVVDQAEDVETAEDELAFESPEFSVYAIVDGETSTTTDDQPYRTTYEFYNADGSAYYFKDDSGKEQYAQILKDGELLEDVGIPTKGASKNAKFVGWFDEDGNEVKVNETKTVNANKTVKLTAKLQGIINVFFVTAVMEPEEGEEQEARSIVTIKQVEYNVGQTEPITVDTSDVTTTAPTAEQAVVGWNRDEAAANAGTKEEDVITLFENGNAENIGDVMLFPAVVTAYWLFFNENDGGTGGSASYTAPQFVPVGGKTVKPEDPHRSGYEFKGWYEDAACTTPFTFGKELKENKTLFAKWEGSSTTYTVIVRVQKTTDAAKLTSASNLSHAEKSYDFYKAYTVSAHTGDTATVANSYKQLANTIDSSGHIKYETCDAPKTVEADGSTVLYVDYQRDVMTIHWRNSANGSDTDTWYGLYGASFADAGKTWKKPASNHTWRTPKFDVLTFMDSFKDFDETADTERIIYSVSSDSSRYSIYFYTENLDGSWKLDQQFAFTGPSYSTFTFANKYDGFTISTYSRNNSSWKDAKVGNSVYKGYSNLYIRYKRNTYNIEYHNGTKGAEGTVVKNEGVKYQASLTNHTNPTVSYPIAADADHYDFIGWFADSGWKTLVTFKELDEATKENYRKNYGVVEFVVIDKMPAHNFPLYAGYALKGWDCALNPNGGTMPDTQAGVFWLEYGAKFPSSLKDTITRDGYRFLGWMVSTVDGDLLDVTTGGNGMRYVGDFSNWTMSEDPWQFDTGITGPTYLTAKWFSKDSLKVVYDAGEGSGAPEDLGAYADHAKTVAFRAPDTYPAGKNFIGWDIVGTEKEEKLQPGATFEVSSDYATDGVVTLKAMYHGFSAEEEVPTTSIIWYANNGTDASVIDENLQINAGTDIRPADTFSYLGHSFLGWAKLDRPEEGGINPAAPTLTEADLYLKYEDGAFKAKNKDGEWITATQVAADNVDKNNDLYAVWKQEYFYVYHSGVLGGNVEKIAIPSDKPTYDLTATPEGLTDGTLYGGYYLKDGISAPTEIGDSTPAYDGDNWTWTTAETANGKAITPAADETYYLKEVPAARFLQPYTHYTYYKANNKLANLWMLTDIDDNMYNEVGFILTQNDVAKVCKSLTVQNAVGGNSVKLTPQKIFKAKGATANDLLAYCAEDGLIQAKAKVRMYWITPDGLTVTGTVEREVDPGADQTKVSIKKTDSDVTSTITK